MTRSAVQSPQNRPAKGVLRETHQQILQLLVGRPEGMRQDELMAATGFARSSVSGFLSELSAVVEDTPEAVQLAGRPPRLHRVKAHLGIVAGIDVGLSRLHVALYDLVGEPLPGDFPLELPLVQDGQPGTAERTLESAAALIERAMEDPRRAGAPLAAVGVSLPGTVQRNALTTTDPALPHWRDEDVPGFLRRRLGEQIGVVLEHEANAAMLAEQRWGRARDVDDAIFVEWSSTISASILIGGRIRHGATGTAGDLGHLRLPLDDEEADALGVADESSDVASRTCLHCNQAMCVQQLVGGLRMADVLHVTSIDEGAVLINTDREAFARVQAMARLLGRAIGVAVALVDPERVIVGGGAPPHLLSIGFEQLQKGAFETAYPRRPEIELSDLGPAAAIRGVVAAAVDRCAVPFLGPIAA